MSFISPIDREYAMAEETFQTIDAQYAIMTHYRQPVAGAWPTTATAEFPGSAPASRSISTISFQYDNRRLVSLPGMNIWSIATNMGYIPYILASRLHFHERAITSDILSISKQNAILKSSRAYF